MNGAAPDPACEPDLTLPNPARVYDHMLGGAHNFAADRAFAARILEALPGARDAAVANRSFVHRAVRACLELGCRQFLDLGSGIPTAEPVHTIAHRHDPAARVAYVDIEPVAVSISRSVLDGVEGATITAADLCDPEAVLAAPGVAGLLDPQQPTAVLAASVLHFVPDDDLLAALLARYCDAVGPGSMLVISHGSTDQDDPAVGEEMAMLERFTKESAQPATSRDRDTLRRLTARLDLIEPGLVDVTRWRPDDPAEPGREVGMYALVGRIRPSSS
ncbi:SAM-dependent methyltransferase [Pseudonocardia nematodicida]|uniref:SAM-dependent methyltransferase n=1 Tax=Pseudonocardia nematodicida TaxID=1206997 RepID=A0ABV1KA83_9PSEU